MLKCMTARQLLGFLDYTNISDPLKFSFRHNYGTKMTLVNIRPLGDKEVVCVTVDLHTVDLSAAFDSLDHSI